MEFRRQPHFNSDKSQSSDTLEKENPREDHSPRSEALGDDLHSFKPH